MKPARYIFLNHGLDMSPGKCAAQAAHAETLAVYDLHREYDCGYDSDEHRWYVDQSALWDKWYGDGHYVKYVMKAEDSTQMFTIDTYLKERGFKTYFVIDEGHTEGTYLVPTALAVELVDKDDERVASIFNEFRLYKSGPRKPSQPEQKSRRWWPFS